MNGGLILEPARRKDRFHDQVFGAAPFMEEIKPLGRDVSKVPDIFQGEENTCVVCAVTWIEQFDSKNNPNLSHEWLRDIAHVGERGATFNQVLEPARKVGILLQEAWNKGLQNIDFPTALMEAGNYRWPGYLYVRDLSKFGIYNALKKSPLIIGVRDWKGVGPHAMVVYDVTEDGQALKGKNWWEEEVDAVVPFEVVVKAAYPTEFPEGFNKFKARLPFLEILIEKIRFFLQKYAI